MRKNFMVLIGLLLIFCCSCEELYENEWVNNSDAKQKRQQEVLLKEGVSQCGMPAIKNFREKKILKDIYELRDQSGLITYTYLFSEMTGKLVYLGESIGYGIPASTQYSNPQKYDFGITLPQSEPNGLFSPASAEGTWILLKDPNSKEVKPIYCEARVIVSPFKINTN